ncbi:MAG: GntR family transcriptional regulator [Sphaerochaetaceae bacterium]
MSAKTRSSDIYNTLTARIITWSYPPGYRLTEEELCSEFGVSRSPVREALNSLASEKLIAKEQHKGYSVRKIDIQEINELYDTRLVLELAVIRNICINGIDDTILEALRTQWESILEELPDIAERSVQADEQFHEALADAGRNKVIKQLLHEIDQRIHFVRLSDITDQDRLRTTCTDHLELLVALQQKDCGKASDVLTRNIMWGKEKVDSAIKEALFHAHRMV